MELVPDGAVLTSVPLNDSLPVVRAAAGASESVPASPKPNTATRDQLACRLICCFLPAELGLVAAWRAAHRRLSQGVDPPSTRARSVGAISGSAPGWRVSAPPSVIQPISFRALSARKSDRTHVL